MMIRGPSGAGMFLLQFGAGRLFATVTIRSWLRNHLSMACRPERCTVFLALCGVGLAATWRPRRS